MRSRRGGGTSPKTMFVESVRYTSTAHAQHASIQEMTAACVSALSAQMSSEQPTSNYCACPVSGKCGHNFHMVRSSSGRNLTRKIYTDYRQHCIVEWIKQDSSKGQCPMCRQSESNSSNFNICDKLLLTICTPEFEWTDPTATTNQGQEAAEA